MPRALTISLFRRLVCSSMRSIRAGKGIPSALVFGLAVIGSVVAQEAGSQRLRQESVVNRDRFETQIRPVLVTVCQDCHGADRQEGHLRLDSSEAARTGGDFGPAVIPGDPEGSWLMKAIRYDHDELQMPPTGKLSDSRIRAFSDWIAGGADWPESERPGIESSGVRTVREVTAEDREFWAFRPLQRTAPPQVAHPDWPAGDIDRFLLSKLEAEGLVPNPDTDRATLLRRLTLDLTGLIPTVEEVRQFAGDDSIPLESVVDRLLASPEFGERFARHWLDVTYFADTTGVGRRVPLHQAWRYRDYVIESFNMDKPYDVFVREQLAGDLLTSESDAERERQIVATGFLALGPWQHFAADHEQMTMDIVDLQIDAIGRTFLGLTLGCARCHDHKFDPIPTADYYALAGILKSTVTVEGGGGWTAIHESDLPVSADERSRHEEAVAAWTRLRDELQAERDKAAQRIDELGRLIEQLKQQPNRTESSGTPAEAPGEAVTTGAATGDAKSGMPADPVELERERKTLQERIPKIDRELAFQAQVRPPAKRALTAADRPSPEDARINRRGNPHVLGDVVPRGFLQIVQIPGAARPSNEHSGRRELAEWIVSRDNPLTARVLVNRIWKHLMGNGLVASTDNFGSRGDRPTHPELLDFLAARLMDQGWSTKALIRDIVLSRAYRMSGSASGSGQHADPDNKLLWRITPRRLDAESLRDSLLLISGRMDRTRGGPTLPVTLDNLHVNSPSFLEDDALLEPHVRNRRSVYMPIMRGSLFRELDLLSLFDFADPDQIVGTRSETIVPTQALFLMNAPFVQQAARELADHCMALPGTEEDRLGILIMTLLGRSAAPEDLRAVEMFLPQGGSAGPEEVAAAWGQYGHSLILSSEFLMRQ